MSSNVFRVHFFGVTGDCNPQVGTIVNKCLCLWLGNKGYLDKHNTYDNNFDSDKGLRMWVTLWS